MRDFLVGVCALALLGGVGQDGKYETISVSQNYDGEFGKVTLLGGCKYSEDQVSCWGPEGQSNADLAAKVKEALLRNGSTYIGFGKKNRIAVFKIEPKTTATGSLQSYLSGSHGSFELNSDGGQVRTVGAIIVAGTDEKTASVKLTINRFEPESKLLRLAVGEQLTYQGKTLKIVKIVKSDLGSSDTRSRYVWTVYGTGAGGYWNRKIVTKDGINIPAVDKNGAPAFVASDLIAPDPRYYSREVPLTKKYNYFRTLLGSGNSIYNYYDNGFTVPGNEFVISTNVDPSKIEGVVFTGSGTQSLEITDVPLDPK